MSRISRSGRTKLLREHPFKTSACLRGEGCPHVTMVKRSQYIRKKNIVQVNLCQKLSFLNWLTHNMTRDCSLTRLPPKIQVQNMLCTNIVLNVKTKTKKQFVCTSCSPHVLSLLFSCIELVNQWTIFVILWVSWCENKCFWQRFTCTKVPILKEVNFGKMKLWDVEHFWTLFVFTFGRDCYCIQQSRPKMKTKVSKSVQRPRVSLFRSDILSKLVL